MSWEAGKRAGPYEILAPLGAGGMGEVYRARDTRLGRTVAIKFLPTRLADQPEARERFEREARAIASLNHPHICSLHDVGREGDADYLVMEYVEGETLAQRIRGGPLPWEEALPLARQIAEAMEAAHERGIMHRDLKPDNIKVVAGNNVKVLDFGLAKALDNRGPAEESRDGQTRTIEPTRAGEIIGTPPYMAPEQMTGSAMDHRADIWAFGAVLYEMLSGQRAFRGRTVSDTLAGVLTKDPDWAGLPEDLPAAIVRLLRRCLTRDPKNRLRDIGEARIAITEVLAGTGDSAEAAPEPHSPVYLMPGVWAAVVVAAALAFLGGRQSPTRTTAGRTLDPVALRAEIPLTGQPPLALDSSSAAFFGYDVSLLAVSPDGRNVVYVGAAEDGISRLYLRRFDSDEIRAIPGTEGAVHPFFAPDGNWIGFLTNDRVMKAPLAGGSPIALCNAESPVRATWLPDGHIYFAEQQGSLLSRVSESGEGRAVVLSPKLAGFLKFSQVLPGGQTALLTRQYGGSSDYAEILAITLSSGQTRRVLGNGYDARYVPPGYLVYGRGGDLYAVAFNLERVEVAGQPQRLATGVRMNGIFAEVVTGVSDSGVLVYVPGGDATRGKPAWVDRRGKTEFLDVEERVYGQVDLSPDGRRLAVEVADVEDYIHIQDVATGHSQQIKSDGISFCPLLSPLGDSIAFTVIRPGKDSRLVYQPLGSDRPQVTLLENREPDIFTADFWARDGRQIQASGLPSMTRRLAQVAPGGTLTEADLKRTPFGFVEQSPDGKWLSTNKESTEVGVQPVGGGRSYQIVAKGGVEPRWCPRCDELFYRSGQKWFSVKLRFQPEFQWEKPQPAFETSFIDTAGWSYAVAADGQRMLVVKRTRELPRDRLRVIQNWGAALR